MQNATDRELENLIRDLRQSIESDLSSSHIVYKGKARHIMTNYTNAIKEHESRKYK